MSSDAGAGAAANADMDAPCCMGGRPLSISRPFAVCQEHGVRASGLRFCLLCSIQLHLCVCPRRDVPLDIVVQFSNED